MNGLQNPFPPGSVPPPSYAHCPLGPLVQSGTAWLPGDTLDLVPGVSPFSLSLGFAIPDQGEQTSFLFTAVTELDP